MDQNPYEPPQTTSEPPSSPKPPKRDWLFLAAMGVVALILIEIAYEVFLTWKIVANVLRSS